MLLDARLSFQSTLPVWGATPCYPLVAVRHDFNPRSPCGERPSTLNRDSLGMRFQSTLPVWGATQERHDILIDFVFQSTLPVWGATSSRRRAGLGSSFQSTLPVWGATSDPAMQGAHMRISIHAPRVGSDAQSGGSLLTFCNFNPRSPCGERPGQTVRFGDSKVFQSTLPVWGATILYAHAGIHLRISIHAPRVGSD